MGGPPDRRAGGPELPSASPSSRLALPLAAAVASLALDVLLLDRGLVLEDEGATVAIASRLASGAVLYRDAPINLGPLAYEIFALVFRVAGTSVILARLVVAIAAAATSAAVAVMARRAGAGSAAPLAPWAFVLLRVLAFPQWHIVFYSPIGMALALGAVATLLAPPSGRAALVSGLLGGAAFVTKQNYGALAMMAGLAIVATGGDALASRARRAALHVVGFGIPVALVVGLFASRGALADLYRGTILFALAAQGSTFVIPRPPLLPTLGPDEAFRSAFLYYVPPLVWEIAFPALGGTALWRRTGLVELALKAMFVLPPLVPLLLLLRARRGERPREARALAGAALLFALLASYPTFDWSHLVYAIVGTIPCAAVLAARPGARRAATGALAVLSVPLLLLTLAARSRYDAPVTGLSVKCTPDVARALDETCRILHREGVRRAIVVPYQPALYLACGIENPTSVDIFLPGFLDDRARREVQEALDGGAWVVRFTKEYGHLPKLADAFPEVVGRLAEPPVAVIPADGFEVRIHRPRPRPEP